MVLADPLQQQIAWTGRETGIPLVTGRLRGRSNSGTTLLRGGYSEDRARGAQGDGGYGLQTGNGFTLRVIKGGKGFPREAVESLSILGSFPDP